MTHFVNQTTPCLRLNKIYKPVIQLWQFKVMTSITISGFKAIDCLDRTTQVCMIMSRFFFFFFFIKFWKCTFNKLVFSRCQIGVQESARMQDFAPSTPELLAAPRPLAVQQLCSWSTRFAGWRATSCCEGLLG